MILRQSPFIFLKRVLLTELIFAFLPLIIALFFSFRTEYETFAIARSLSYNVFVILIVAGLQALIIAVLFFAWYIPRYLLSADRITLKRGGIMADRVIVQLDRSLQSDIQQGPLARRLDYGSVILRTTAGSAEMKNIDNPRAIADVLSRWSMDVSTKTGTRPEYTPAQWIAQGEGQFVEFKASLMWDYRLNKANKALYEPVLKNVAGFLNATGGLVLVGVADDGEVLGLERDLSVIRRGDLDGFENVFNQAFNSMIGVEFRPYVKVSFPQIDEKVICMIDVMPADRPAYLSYQNEESFYIRAGNASQPLRVSKAVAYIHSHYSQGDMI